MAFTVLKKPLNFKPISTLILARTHRTAKRNNLYSTINPFGPGHSNNIPHPTPMASTILKKALNFTPINTPIFARTYCTTERENMYGETLCIYRDPDLLVPQLEQWVQEGKRPEIRHIVQDLYDHELFEAAAQIALLTFIVFEWVSSKGLPSSVGLNYVQLGLIFKVYGLEAAESYFNNLNDEDKTHTVYRTLLKCYFKEGFVGKCIAHLQKMMELGFLYTAPCFNDLLFLYAYRGQLEKIPVVLSYMKENGVPPDDFSYRICMYAYGARSDISSMEVILKEMENQPHINIEWTTYVTVANIYIKAGLSEKASIYLKKCSSNLNLCYSEFRTIEDSIMKSTSALYDRDFEEAEKYFKEWECYLFTPMGGECQVNDGHIN